MAILSGLGSPDVEVSIVIVNDHQIAKINSEYLKRTGPTNVIAFAMRDGDFAHLNPDLLGDVIVSIDTAEKEAEKAAMDPELRFVELLVHGILHLFGYEHENDPKGAIEMEAKSDAILKNLGSYEGLLLCI